MATQNQVGVGLSGSSGTGSFAGTTSPSFTTPALGTPSAGVLSSCTGYAQSALTGLGTGVSTALGNNANAVGGATTIVADTTWTPVFSSSGAGTATYSTQTGGYTQIGPIVFFEVLLILTGLPNAGNVSITGFPVSVGSNYCVASIWANNLSAAVTSPLIGIMNPSSTAMALYTFAAGSVTQLTVAGCSASSQFIISGYYHT